MVQRSGGMLARRGAAWLLVLLLSVLFALAAEAASPAPTATAAATAAATATATATAHATATASAHAAADDHDAHNCSCTTHDDGGGEAHGGDEGGGEHAEEGHVSQDPLVLLFLFGTFAAGALLRHAFMRTPVPYTVLLILVGLGFGFSTRIDESVEKYATLADIDPHLLLFVFLPVLIFESAFAMDVHTFKRVIGQVLVLAGPGLLIATFLTAVVAKYLYNYDWGWYPALLFGTILSATDPVAVVALLKELGASKILGTIIEGESLLNDGIAIVIFTVFHNGTIGGDSVMDALDIFLYFLRVALGGPVFGWACGRVTVFWLSNVFNDALVEITITLTAAYLTFYLGEAVLGVSGVLAVVALGVEINSRRTDISPEVENFLHHFWEMMAYLANTVIFLLVGVVIAMKAFDEIESEDWMYLFATYFAINVIRIIVIWVLSPILTRIGYGLDWKNALVMAWGGLRGAVGLALALIVANDARTTDVGNKILFQTSGIVVLTLVVNAPTVKTLLNALGMSEVSEAKRIVMATAVNRITEAQRLSIEILKTDRFLSDSNWDVVVQAVVLRDPYFKEEKQSDPNSLIAIAKRSIDEQLQIEGNRDRMHMTPAEMAELAEDARIRFLKAEKTSYWKQYEDGVLGRDAVRVLTATCDQAMDEKDHLVTADDLAQYFAVPRWYEPVTRYINKLAKEDTGLQEIVPPPTNRRLLVWYKISVSAWLEYLIMMVIIYNMATIIIDEVSEDEGTLEVMKVHNYVFTAIYIVEAVIKMLGMRRFYWKIRWNIFDFAIMLISVADLIIDEALDDKDSGFSPAIIRTARVLKILRISRILRLFKVTLPSLRRSVQAALNRRLSFGYDVGIAFVVAQEEVTKLIGHFVTDTALVTELKRRSNENRLKVLKTLGLIRKDYPGIAISVKTRQAIRSVLNRGMDTIKELHEDGLLDEGDSTKLQKIVEVNMKKVQKAPPSMKEPSPEDLLFNVAWLSGMPDALKEFFVAKADRITYEVDSNIVRQGDKSDGVYILVSGLVRVSAVHGSTTWTDYLGPGCVIGEMGVLVDSPRSASIDAETVVTMFFISEQDLRTAMEDHPPLAEQLWRVAGVRLAYSQLLTISPYYNWAASKLKLHCEKGTMVHCQANRSITLNDSVDAIVLAGRLFNEQSMGDKPHEAPQLLPKSVRSVVAKDDNTRMLVISCDANNMGFHEEENEWSVLTDAGIRMPKLEAADHPAAKLDAGLKAMSGSTRRTSTRGGPPLGSGGSYSETAGVTAGGITAGMTGLSGGGGGGGGSSSGNGSRNGSRNDSRNPSPPTLVNHADADAGETSIVVPVPQVQQQSSIASGVPQVRLSEDGDRTDVVEVELQELESGGAGGGDAKQSGQEAMSIREPASVSSKTRSNQVAPM